MPTDYPTHWRMLPLYEIVEKFLNGGTPSTAVPEYWDGTIPWITGADAEQRVTTTARKHITKRGVRESSTNIVPKGSILLVTRTGVGKVSISGVDVAISQDLTGVIPNHEHVDVDYLYRQLKYLGPELQRLSQGSIILGIQREEVEALEIPLPHLTEQRRIAEILDTADEAIRQTERLIAKLKLVKAGLLHDLLTRGLDEGGRLRDPQAHPEQFKDSPLGIIPKEWEICILEDLVTSAVDGPFGSNLKTEHYVSTPGMRVVRLQNIGSGYFDDADNAYISNAHARALSRHEVAAGDLLIASLGDENHPIARACLYPADASPGIVKADCFRFRLKHSLAVHAYVMHVFNCTSTRGDVNALGHGVTRDRVTLTTVQRVRIRVPPVEEQTRLAAAIEAHDTRVRAEEAALEKLRQVKRALMDDLLTGRVRVT